LIEHLPYGNKPKRLPVVLSQDEVLRFIAAVDKPMYRVAATTAHATGVRVSESRRPRWATSSAASAQMCANSSARR